MRHPGSTVLRRGRYTAICSEGFCRGDTADGTSGLERGIFDILDFVLGNGSHDVPLPMDLRRRADMIFRLSSEPQLRDALILAVEYDGHYWHKDRLETDLRKTACLRDMGAHAVLRIREEPLDLTSALDVSVPRNPTPQLCAQLVLAHLMHTLAMRLDTEVAVRIEHALAAASSTLDKTAIHCRDCRRLLRQIQRDGRSCVLEAHPRSTPWTWPKSVYGA